MFERFAEQSRRAVGYATRQARDRGHPHVDSDHLLLGLLAESEPVRSVLSELGAPPAELAAGVEAELGTGTGSPDPIPFSAAALAVFRSAESDPGSQPGHPVTTLHLLDALLRDGRGAGARLLGERAVTAARVHQAAASPLQAAVSLPDLGPPPPLPGRQALRRWCGYAVAGYAAAAALLAVTAQRPGTVALVIALSCTAGAAIPLGWLLAGPRRVRRTARRDRVVPLPAGDRSGLLARSGIPAVVFFATPEPRRMGHAVAFGRHNLVALHVAFLRRADWAPFVTAHELAHVARRDSGRSLVAGVLLVAVGYEALYAWDGVARRAVMVLLAAAVFVAQWWSAELACDLIAARWVGFAAGTAFLTEARRLIRDRPHRPRRLLRIGLGLLGHPPIRLRLFLLSQTAAVTADGPGR